MTPILARPAQDVLRHASTALGKVDHYGPRGLTMVTFDEIEAMALLLAALGVVPTIPGHPPPPPLFAPVERPVK